MAGNRGGGFDGREDEMNFLFRPLSAYLFSIKFFSICAVCAGITGPSGVSRPSPSPFRVLSSTAAQGLPRIGRAQRAGWRGYRDT